LPNIFKSKKPKIETTKDIQKYVRELIADIEKNSKIYTQNQQAMKALLSKKVAEKPKALKDYLVSKKGIDLVVKPIDDVPKDVGFNSAYLKHIEYTAKKESLEAQLKVVQKQLDTVDFDGKLETKAGEIVQNFKSKTTSVSFDEVPITTGTQIPDTESLKQAFETMTQEITDCKKWFEKLDTSGSIVINCPEVPDKEKHDKLLSDIKDATYITVSDMTGFGIDSEKIETLIKKRLEIFNSRLSLSRVNPHITIAEEVVGTTTQAAPQGTRAVAAPPPPPPPPPAPSAEAPTPAPPPQLVGGEEKDALRADVELLKERRRQELDADSQAYIKGVGQEYEDIRREVKAR
jgi:hypothetical protein